MIKSTRDLQCKVSLLACYSDLLSSISQYLGNTSEQHLFQYLGNSWYSWVQQGNKEQPQNLEMAELWQRRMAARSGDSWAFSVLPGVLLAVSEDSLWNTQQGNTFVSECLEFLGMQWSSHWRCGPASHCSVLSLCPHAQVPSSPVLRRAAALPACPTPHCCPSCTGGWSVSSRRELSAIRHTKSIFLRKW